MTPAHALGNLLLASALEDGGLETAAAEIGAVASSHGHSRRRLWESRGARCLYAAWWMVLYALVAFTIAPLVERLEP